jgi:uncharacterized protein (TIGR03000 family)
MRRFTVFTLLMGAMCVTMADDVSAFGHHRCGGGCGGGRCHHSRCHRGGCCYGGGCYSGGCGVGCAGGVCALPGGGCATITCYLPADAVLTVDGTATASTSAVRTFVTPQLPVGQTYAYTMQARLPSGEVVTQQVTFRAGQQTTVRFDAPAVAVTQR